MAPAFSWGTNAIQEVSTFVTKKPVLKPRNPNFYHFHLILRISTLIALASQSGMGGQLSGMGGQKQETKDGMIK